MASCVCVYSWDALALRGQIRERPDLLTVWNEAQRRDAAEIHGLAAERVAVTGAQAYDHWFQWEPATTREEFCARVGLPADRPFLLYLGSSGGYIKDELPYVREWVERLRASGRPELEEVGVLVRPHPKTKESWGELLESGPDRTRVWPAPAHGARRLDPAQRLQRLRAGRAARVLRLDLPLGGRRRHQHERADRERDRRAARPHAARGPLALRAGGDAPLPPARGRRGGVAAALADFDEHAGHLAEVVRGDWDGGDAQREYVRSFVRPHGLDEPATPRFAATSRRSPRGRTSSRRAARVAAAAPAAAPCGVAALTLFPASEADLQRLKDRGRKRAQRVDRTCAARRASAAGARAARRRRRRLELRAQRRRDGSAGRR